MYDLESRFDAVLFDLGNTLVAQADPGVPIDELTVTWLPGAEAALDALHGRVPLAIVSNTTTLTAADIARLLGPMADRFATIVATAELGEHKPSPVPVRVALERLGVRPERALLIGDNDSDRAAALAAGVHFAWSGPDLHERITAQLLHADALERALDGAFPHDPAMADAARARLDGLAKPAGSLGRLEDAVCRLAVIERTPTPTVDPAAVAVFVADHGIAADDSVTPWPQVVTAIMRETIAGGRAAVSVLAREAQVYVDVTDVGTLPGVPSTVRDARIADGTADLRSGQAMTRLQALQALEVGAATAERLIAGGTRTLAVGEVGMGNTTAAAALIAALCDAPAATVTGRGAGIDDATLARKTVIVAEAVAALPDGADVIEVLARVGGLEIAAMAGCIIGAASLGIPVILDGVITQAAALVAVALEPRTAPFLIAAHSSAEPGSQIALQHLGLRALLDLSLRLGEGTGAALAIPLLRAACAATRDMATIAELLA